MNDSTENQNPKIERAKTNASSVFAVDRETWERACELGINPAVAYLVLARGTGADNRTTAWSAKAIEDHTGIGRDRAPRAIAALKDAGLIVQTAAGRRPRYAIQPAYAVLGCPSFRVDADEAFAKAFKPAWIWLSNRLVTKFEWETRSLLECVRRTQSVAALRLFVILYGDLQFSREGGLEWREGGVRQFYDRAKIGKAGEYTVYGFRPAKSMSIDPAGFPARYGDTFESAFAMLCDLGIVAMVPHLVEAPGYEAEILHSLADRETGLPNEAQINEDAMIAAQRLLPAEAVEKAEREGFTRLVPLRSLMDQANIVGIARLKYSPEARLSQQWEARNAEDWSACAYAYHMIKPAISRSLSRSSSTS